MISIYWVIIILLFIISVIGVFVPMVPDIIPVWISVLIYQFGPFNYTLPRSFWFVLIIFSVISLLADFLTNAIVVKKSGGSNLSVIAALIGLAIGLVFLGPLGIIIGPFAAIFLAEYYQSQSKEYNKPFKIAFSTVFAFIGSGIVKAILLFSIIIWFFILVL
ncbi:MAG: DUF456 family protein [Halanaerobiales bacterium]|nr:DUF456 family protein [Halanaerobiales bacterium]